MLSSEAWLANAGADFYNGVATTSLRLAPATTLTNTYGTPTSRKQMSFGGWVKRGVITKYCGMWGATSGGAVDQAYIVFNANDTLFVQISQHGVGNQFLLTTDRLFRDTSAWYHLWVQIDSTDVVDADRVKLWINGIRETKAPTTTIPDGSPDVIAFNVSGVEHVFGHPSGSYGGDLYYSDWYFIDGLAVSSVDTVGEFKNGAFIPKAYTPSAFGTNGWHLKFDQKGVSATEGTTTIGADSSGKGTLRHWDSTSDTNVVASDCGLPDSPELNFSTLNPLDKHATFPTLAEGNLKTVNAGNAWFYCRSTFSVTSGKWYVEIRQTGKYIFMGVMAQTLGLTTNSSSNSTGVYACFNDNSNLKPYSTGTSGTDSGDFTDGDIVGLAYDYDAQTLKIYQNNTLRATVSSIPKTEAMSFMCGTAQITNTTVWNFGQDSTFAGAISAGGNTDGNGVGDFAYAPPSGFIALASSNIAEPTIGANSSTQADNHFGTLTWSGDNDARDISVGASGITGDVDFTPDFSWIKRRNGATNGSDHLLIDSVRGVNGHKGLATNGTQAEGLTEAGSSWTNFGDIVSFKAGGFNGSASGTEEAINESGGTYVAWNWLAGGTASSNTDGSITSSVSANTDAGFSIVSYTGNGSAGATYGHGLGAVPAMIITKGRNVTDNWMTRHKDYSANTSFIELNTSNAEGNATDIWNNTAPTSSVISVGTGGTVNTNTKLYISYVFSEVEGYSKFGSYTGNGLADGTFVFTGFRPAWILVKSTTSGRNWAMYDNVRDTSNPVQATIKANLNNAEFNSASYAPFDFVSNGLKLRLGGTGSTVSSDVNISGQTYIYMAFAEQPFKYSNAR